LSSTALYDGAIDKYQLSPFAPLMSSSGAAATRTQNTVYPVILLRSLTSPSLYTPSLSLSLSLSLFLNLSLPLSPSLSTHSPSLSPAPSLSPSLYLSLSFSLSLSLSVSISLYHASLPPLHLESRLVLLCGRVASVSAKDLHLASPSRISAVDRNRERVRVFVLLVFTNNRLT
jgi:hypothetical protein